MYGGEENMELARKVYRWGIVAVIIAAAVVLFWLLIYDQTDPSIENKTKGNILSIEMLLDKYKAGNGEYPAYLLGGDKEGWDYYNANRPEGSPYLCDPLIEAGYTDSYPVNPFLNAHGRVYKRDRKAARSFIEKANRVSNIGFDPRFGMNGDKIGNVLADPIIVLDQVIPEFKGYPRMCPGHFFYAAIGEVSTCVDIELSSPDDYAYLSYPAYSLGGFGYLRLPGEDTIRWRDMSGYIPDEFPYISSHYYYRTELEGDVKVPLRLPEVLGGIDPETTPYWPYWHYQIVEMFSGEKVKSDTRDPILECPDGIPDGVIAHISAPGLMR